MPLSSVIARCLGNNEAARRPQQRDTAPVPRATASTVPEYQSRDCINCTRRVFRGSTVCDNCGRLVREEVVGQELLAAAIECMDRPVTPEPYKKLRGKGGAPTDVLLAYDDRCRRHRDVKTLGSFIGRSHPERPERVAAIMTRLHQSGLLKRCQRFKGREVTEQELLAAHDKALVAAVEKATKVAMLEAERDKTTWYGPLDAQLEAMELRDSKHIQDVYFNASTALCARLAAGSAAEVAQRVVSGFVRHGAAIIRPPGHHAESSVAMGFCYYNNAAVAARAGQAAGARRVAIVDWDVHHGNGTQSIFYNDPTVLYMSTHRYDHGSFYPGSGAADETGAGPGVGFTVNVPWNHSGVRDADMLAAFRHVIVPLAAEFRPDLVIVSAGFDAAEGDPLGGCRVSTAAFSHFAAMLSALAPTVLLLEGGYNLIATATATEACLRVLLGEPPLPLQDDLQGVAGMPTLPTQSPATDTWVTSGLEGASDSALQSVLLTLQAHSEYWAAARSHKAVVEAAVEVRRRWQQQQQLPAESSTSDVQPEDHPGRKEPWPGPPREELAPGRPSS